MRLFRTTGGVFVEEEEQHYLIAEHGWDSLLSRDDLPEFLSEFVARGKALGRFHEGEVLAPIEGQEVWAAGVTYYRSRGARMEESKDAGGGNFYDRVYSAERPELFFKSMASRTVGSGGKVRIRGDAKWSVPEPELTLVVSRGGRIVGYTIGNDMSSRDIEGENPLYLPQAKVYNGSCALGPGILVTGDPLARSTEIKLEILRGERIEFEDSVELTELKRDPKMLVEYLFRDNSFPAGVFLMTGTGIVPPSSFTLERGDRVRITIEPIGVLENVVE
ncbi:MAG TPA: fumarylacetoacetate hydrolase family protein [Terracidiphilus sp.]|nr:fumarylacetoacetate hydrolase family protein [Terracidiphilus sp.]